MVAASLRADATDTDTFFEVLASKLAAALGERVRLEQGGRLKRGARIQGLSVEVGDLELSAERHRGAVRCQVRHSVRGIVLRSEDVEVDEWLRVLVAALVGEAERNDRTRAALGALLA